MKNNCQRCSGTGHEPDHTNSPCCICEGKGMTKSTAPRKKVTKKQFPFPNDKRLKNVKFIVFGDSHDFWTQCHNDVEIEQLNPGIMFQYHAFTNKMPCWGSGYFYNVNGILTLFVDPSGAYTDYLKFKEYVFAMCGMKPGHDTHTDSNNYHNHIALSRRTKEQRIKSFEKEIAEKERDIKYLKKCLEEMKPKKELYWIKNHPTDHNLCPICDKPIRSCHVGDFCGEDGCPYVDGVAWLTDEQVKQYRGKIVCLFADSASQIQKQKS